MPHTPSYSLRQAAHHTGLSIRHLRRLLDAYAVEFTFDRGVRLYPRARIETWWREYQLQDFDRAKNLGPYGRRARSSDGEQVCPGVGDADEPPCGQPLGRTPTGRRARMCPACRAEWIVRRRRRRDKGG